MKMIKYINGKPIQYEETLPSNFNGYENIPYEELVVQFIREKYSLDDELAIQRQKETKPDEWSEYFSYCEECKAKAKEMVGKVNG